MARPVTATDFLRDPAKLAAAPVYAVFGPEDYLRRKCLTVLRKTLEQRKFELKRAEPDDSIAPILDELRSPAMFGASMAIFVTNRRVGNRQEVTTRFKEELLRYIDKPSSRNVLVFDASTWQRNLAVPKRVSAEFATIHCEELKPWDARGWQQIAAAAAAEVGLKPGADALAALRDYTGASLARAESELHKLALICTNGRVSAADVALACGYDGADVTFALCDAILMGDTKTALSHAAKMAGKAEIGGVLSLLGLLRLQVNGLGRVALALRRGAREDEAVSGAGLRVREHMKAAVARTARGIDRGRSMAAVEVLLTADETMKTASPDAGNLLIGTVARLCEALHAGEPQAAGAR